MTDRWKDSQTNRQIDRKLKINEQTAETQKNFPKTAQQSSTKLTENKTLPMK